jgi:energy-coupling factor transporter ATP-binding protein EcfA2
VIHAGAGYLFAGPSGSGKTTIAHLSAEHHVLSDEMPIVEFRDGTAWIVGTPFNGLFREKSPGAAPLRAILLLTHGPTHALAKVGPGEAAAVLAAEIAPPVGLDQTSDGSTAAAMLEFATRLALTVPVRRLIFRPDPGFWRVVHEGLPAKREETP